MRGLLAASTLLAAILAAGWLLSTLAAAQTPAATFQARVGDKIRVVGAPIGCRVVRMSQLEGRIVVDCRRAGPLTGTYGTLFSGREAALIEFVSRRTARRIAYAVHRRDKWECR
jgi:hypothetical protein